MRERDHGAPEFLRERLQLARHSRHLLLPRVAAPVAELEVVEDHERDAPALVARDEAPGAAADVRDGERGRVVDPHRERPRARGRRGDPLPVPRVQWTTGHRRCRGRARLHEPPLGELHIALLQREHRDGVSVLGGDRREVDRDRRLALRRARREEDEVRRLPPAEVAVEVREAGRDSDAAAVRDALRDHGQRVPDHVAERAASRRRPRRRREDPRLGLGDELGHVAPMRVRGIRNLRTRADQRAKPGRLAHPSRVVRRVPPRDHVAEESGEVRRTASRRGLATRLELRGDGLGHGERAARGDRLQHRPDPLVRGREEVGGGHLDGIEHVRPKQHGADQGALRGEVAGQGAGDHAGTSAATRGA